MFADDTQIDISNANIDIISSTSNEDLANVSNWMAANKLSLNANKTEYMIIGSNKRLRKINTDPIIKLGDNDLKRVKDTKSLGVMIDETLTWDAHVNLITKKVNKSMNVLRRLRDFVDRGVLLTVYKTLIQPHFDYCYQVWGCLGITLSDKLQRLQNRAARIFMKYGYKQRSIEVLQQLQLTNHEARRD